MRHIILSSVACQAQQ